MQFPPLPEYGELPWHEKFEAWAATVETQYDEAVRTARADIGALGVETIDVPGIPASVRAAFAFADGGTAAYIHSDGRYESFAQTLAAIFEAISHGDSTSQGADLADPPASRWTTKLGDELDTTIENKGLSGARAEEIAVFAGGISTTATVDGGSIPANGNASIQSASLSVDPWRAGMGPVLYPSFPAVAITDDGQVIPGVFKYQHNTLRYFARSTPGAAIPTAKIEIRATPPQGKFLFLGMGTNNEPEIAAGRQTLADVVGWYQAITSRWPGEYLVWGLLDRGYNERPGTATGDLITALEARLGEIYGDRYLNVRKYLSSAQALTDAAIFQPGFVATADDLQAQGVGRTPPSFRYNFGSVHLNELGHQLQARYFLRYLTLRGIAS